MAGWKNKFDQEILMARQARFLGKEGQARVCARRAAGIIVREYFLLHGFSVSTLSSYELLLKLLKISNLNDQARRAAEYLTLHVTHEFNLPVEVDLIEEVKILGRALIPGFEEA